MGKTGNYDRGELEGSLKGLYGEEPDVFKRQLIRYSRLINTYTEHFGEAALDFFSTPGRTEIGGNHTDHNNGHVLAASVTLDSIAAVSRRSDQKVVLYSEGYKEPFIVDVSSLAISKDETGTTLALIRGVAAGLKTHGYDVGGLNACITSEVLPGSGLSSSASIEVLIGTILNTLYNGGKVEPERIAKIGQYAENNYFGKPCGLMDQLACAVGGIITIDFKDPQNPQVKKVHFDFNQLNYGLIVVNTGSTHADLTREYASVPIEMKAVAKVLRHSVMREVKADDLMKNMAIVRRRVGDRAVLRALHFLHENERVLNQVKALEDGDFARFLELVKASGNSSFKWLQNIYSNQNAEEQGVTLGLALTEQYVSKIQAGACRVHGGGFAGTIQAFLPNDKIDGYIDFMDRVFKKDNILVLKIRQLGTLHLH